MKLIEENKRSRSMESSYSFLDLYDDQRSSQNRSVF